MAQERPAHHKENRTGSLRERLNAAGLLDEVMLRYESDENVNVIHRWMKTQGIDGSPSALRQVLKAYPDWAYEEDRRACLEQDLPEDLEEATRKTLQRQMLVMARRCRTTKEGRDVMAMFAENVKLRHEEHKDVREERRDVRAEKEFARKLTETRLKGAEFIHEVLSEAGRMERLRAMHARNTENSAPIAKHLADIITEVWGDQAGVQTSNKEAA